MKRLSFLLLLFLSTTPVQAQQRAYQSLFGKDSTVWNVHAEYADLTIPYYLPTLVYKFSGRNVIDTTINGKGYKRPWVATYHRGKVYPEFQDFLIREDTLTGKVYERILDPLDTFDYEIMNFSLNKGDSCKITRHTIFTSVVDSVFYDAQGRKHIQIQYQPNYPLSVEYIEGVGSNWCFTFHSYFPSNVHGCALICSHKDGVLVYQDLNSGYGSACFSWGALQVDSRISSELVKILPNPAAGNAILQFSQEGKYRAAVYDLQGRMLWQKETTEKQLAVPSQHWPTGMYYIQVFSQAQGPQYLKFVKQ